MTFKFCTLINISQFCDFQKSLVDLMSDLEARKIN